MRLSQRFEKLLSDISYDKSERARLVSCLLSLHQEGLVRVYLTLTGSGDSGHGVEGSYYDDSEESFDFWQIRTDCGPLDQLLFSIATTYVPGFENGNGGGVEVGIRLDGDGVCRVKYRAYYNEVRELIEKEVEDYE